MTHFGPKKCTVSLRERQFATLHLFHACTGWGPPNRFGRGWAGLGGFGRGGALNLSGWGGGEQAIKWAASLSLKFKGPAGSWGVEMSGEKGHDGGDLKKEKGGRLTGTSGRKIN